jgi:Tol biopolymer transport system component
MFVQWLSALAIVGGVVVALPAPAVALGSGAITGRITDSGAVEILDSFSVFSSGAETFDASDSASDLDASSAATQTYTETFAGEQLEEVDVAGSATATVGTSQQRRASASSTYFARLPGLRNFTLTGTLSGTAVDHRAQVVVRIEDDTAGIVLEIRFDSSQGDSISVSETGTLPEEPTLDIAATASRDASPTNTTALASFDLTLTLEPPSCPVAARTDTSGSAGDGCIPTGHLVYVSPNTGGRGRIVVAGADPDDPSTPTNGALLLRGAADSLDHPAWSPEGGLIAVTDGNQIAHMSAGGSNLDPLTETTTGQNFGPAYSPDGGSIAFVSTRDGNPEIYVMGALGENERRLTNHPALDSTPAWSLDGTKIAFVSTRRGQPDIFVLNADGTGTPRRLTNDPAADLRPEFVGNDKIVFATRRDGNTEIYVMGALGQEPENLTENPADDTQPVVSPDRAFIAFQTDRDGNQEIYTMPVTGGTATNLTNTPGESETEHSWSTSSCEIYGSNGDDDFITSGVTACGGAGDDQLTGGPFQDGLDGGMDNDRLEGQGGADIILGGDEEPQAGVVNDNLIGGEGVDIILAGDGNDTVTGGGDRDLIEGGDGDDDIEGDLGTASPGGDDIDGGAGADTINGGDLADTIRGNDGADTIEGGDGDDVLIGMKGDDTIDGNAGLDRMSGGPDRDTFTACDGDIDAMSGGPGNRPGDSQDQATFDQDLDSVIDVEVLVPC